jgi:hypothetical protein
MPPQAASATLFGGSPSTTSTPSQGSITLYTDAYCKDPLSESPTNLLVGTCFNSPIAGINAVSINTLPSCLDYGTPLLVVSNLPDCKNSTTGTAADSGVLDQCQGFSSSVDKAEVGSMEFVCYGRGVSSVENTAAETTTGYAAATSSPSYTTSAAADATGSGSGTGDDEDQSHSNCCQCDCCCCCVVM